MSLYEDRRDRMDPLDAKPAVPRPWAAMFVTWTSLLDSLCAIVGAHAGVPMVAEASAAVWRWMWSLPPCSDARKAAFTLGAAALRIERWRRATDPAEEDDRGPWRRAEALLHIAAWHVDDARAEALICARDGRERPIPAHERVYERDADGLVFIGQRGWALGLPWTPEILARAILADHFEYRRGAIKGSPLKLGKQFTEFAVAFLPDGPWVMTTRDVGQFLELVMEDLA